MILSSCKSKECGCWEHRLLTDEEDLDIVNILKDIHSLPKKLDIDRILRSMPLYKTDIPLKNISKTMSCYYSKEQTHTNVYGVLDVLYDICVWIKNPDPEYTYRIKLCISNSISSVPEYSSGGKLVKVNNDNIEAELKNMVSDTDENNNWVLYTCKEIQKPFPFVGLKNTDEVSRGYVQWISCDDSDEPFQVLCIYREAQVNELRKIALEDGIITFEGLLIKDGVASHIDIRQAMMTKQNKLFPGIYRYQPNMRSLN